MNGIVIYTDFDGVLNAFPDPKVMRRGGQARLGWLKDGDPRKTLYDTANAFLLDHTDRVDLGSRGRCRIRWSGELAAAYAALAERPEVELDWLTTWQPWTGLLEPRLNWRPGLAETVRWYDPVGGLGLLTGKRRTVYRRVEAEAGSADPAAVVWIDDEEVGWRALTEIESLEPAAPVLLVRPDARIGVSRRQWALVARFADDPSGFPPATLDEEPTIHARGGHLGL